MRGSQEAEALLAPANDKVAQPRTLFLASKKSVGSPSHGQRVYGRLLEKLHNIASGSK